MNEVKMPSVEEQMKNMQQKEDKDIDFSDIPEILDWSDATRGKLYHPIKKHVTLRLDADVVEWFKQHHPKYQTAINAALRQHIHSQQ